MGMGWRVAALSQGGGALRGVSVLVTAGGTREPIDSVRFVGNSSSGRMGFALAAQAAERGAQVTLIAANVSLPAPPGVRVVEVGTAGELKDAAEREFAGAQVLLMAAAVADFAPVAAEGKIKKGGRERLELVLEPTPDVLSGLSATRRPGQTLVGFAAEHGAEGLEHARGKLVAKGLDADRLQRHLARRDRLRLGRERGHDPHLLQRRRRPSLRSTSRRPPRSR